MARDILLDTKYWFVILAENQYYLGRSFILFKGEARQLSELSNSEFLDLKLVINLMEKAFTATFGATHFNWTCLMNDYYKPKNSDKRKELHLHFWPRYEHPVKVGDEIFTDETFGHHYDKTKEKLASAEILAEITKKIKVAL